MFSAAPQACKHAGSRPARACGHGTAWMQIRPEAPAFSRGRGMGLATVPLEQPQGIPTAQYSQGHFPEWDAGPLLHLSVRLAVQVGQAAQTARIAVLPLMMASAGHVVYVPWECRGLRWSPAVTEHLSSLKSLRAALGPFGLCSSDLSVQRRV